MLIAEVLRAETANGCVSFGAKMGRNIQHKDDVNLADYTVVAIAEDIDLAEEYIGILTARRVPSMTRMAGAKLPFDHSVEILVPADKADYAREIIESQRNFDDFLTAAFNDSSALDDEDDEFYEDKQQQDDSDTNSDNNPGGED